ncbi:hypothetical protein GGI14_002442 [Coemansia sp. S680]|nr:hypothetical protein GGI14_002442 [Coemansia sp. S680]
MYEVYLQRSPVSSTYLAENVYHLYMHTLLSLLIGVGGFEIDHEGKNIKFKEAMTKYYLKPVVEGARDKCWVAKNARSRDILLRGSATTTPKVLWVQKPFTSVEIARHDMNNLKFMVNGGNLKASTAYT